MHVRLYFQNDQLPYLFLNGSTQKQESNFSFCPVTYFHSPKSHRKKRHSWNFEEALILTDVTWLSVNVMSQGNRANKYLFQGKLPQGIRPPEYYWNEALTEDRSSV